MTSNQPRSERTATTDLELALAAMAQPIAGSLEVRRVWDHVADACRSVVPFDAMGIVRLEPDGQVRAVAAAGELFVKPLENRLFPRSRRSSGPTVIASWSSSATRNASSIPRSWLTG